MKKICVTAAIAAALTAARPAAVLCNPRADADPDPETMLKEVNAKLTEITDKVKSTAETALKEAKKSGEVAAETKETADKLLVEQTNAKKIVDDLKAMVEGLDSKMTDVAQAMAEGRNKRPDSVMTLGKAVVAEEDKIKAFLEGGARGNLSIRVGAAITTADGSGGGLIYNEEEREPVRLPRRRLRIRDLVTQGNVGSDLVIYRKQVLRTDNAAMVAEGAAAPESSYGWEKATAQVKKISHVTNISEEAMADADQLQTEIDGEMRYGLDLEEEKQLLAGDGLGENLSGLITEATPFAAAAGLPNATRIDRLRLAILQVTLADYIPSAIVLNPTDWTAIDLLKNADGNFIFGNPGAQSTPMLWGKDVVESNTMTVGEWLVGDLMIAATLYDRQDTEVLISSEHDQNFVEDMLTMKARKRLAFAIKRAAAMVTGDFTFV